MIDRNISLKKLEIFLSFMSKGNIGLVAEALHLSNVSVHRALHTLEEDVHCPLFIHKGRMLQALPSAYTLAEYAKEIIELTERAIDATRQAGGLGRNKLRIGTMYSLTIDTIPKIVLDFKLKKPDISIDLIMGSNKELLEKLENGQLDAIFISINEKNVNKNIFATLPLFEDELFMAGSIDSPLLLGKKVDLQKFKEQNFISLEKGFATYHSFKEAFENAHVNPTISLYVNNIFSLINLVQAGVGYSLLPGRIKSTYRGTMRMLPIHSKKTISQTIGLVFLKNREHDRYILTLLALSRMYALNYHNPASTT